MAKGTALCTSIINLLYNGIAIADVAENDTTSPNTTTGLGLYTITPGVGGTQLTNEAGYTGYTRLGVSRVGYAGYTAASSGATQNAALIQFGQSSTSETLTYVATGSSAAGAGVLWHIGALNAPLDVANLIVPQFLAGQLQITES